MPIIGEARETSTSIGCIYEKMNAKCPQRCTIRRTPAMRLRSLQKG